MTITELATLEIVSPFSWDSPEIQSFFRAASESQSAWSGYPLFFFQDKCVVKEIYLLSGWESVEAHMDWIASPRNKELLLLKLGEGLFHVASLVHMNIDFSKIPRDTTYIVWGSTKERKHMAMVMVGTVGKQREKCWTLENKGIVLSGHTGRREKEN
ncbi:hypothetical protein A0H81_14280 [Grifola frondosa]|uniref:ABM domain-containing protein n=1 Tax=Grifola frondosa TaxID=5627 RepID=A0A1C7LLY1_GRIFR|nr:hypothetical protein A0H81_14280 [Grifola frondosa]